jgi:SAM-dependent methyltransferase
VPKHLRLWVKRVVPQSVLYRAWNAYCRLRALPARRNFERAAVSPAYLGWEELERLQESYQPQEWDYLYDIESLRERGRERARKMVGLVGRDQARLQLFLDLGAWDGMSCAALQEMGKETVAIDIRPEGFADEARHKGVRFVQMDAASLGFLADTFDMVFSFNSFEHFPDPDRTFREALRVVRPGGYIYLDFGPLFWSAKGAHQFRTIHVPYNQCLFTRQLLVDFAERKGLELMGFFWMNEWTVDQFRNLWRKYAGQAQLLRHYELYNADHANVICQYPSCFKSKTDNFDNFLVAYNEVLFRKR